MSEVDPAHGFPEIPTMPTEQAEVGESATALLDHLQSVDFASIGRSIENAASSIDRLASAENLPKVLAEAVATLQSYRQLALHLDAGLTPLTPRSRRGDERSAAGCSERHWGWACRPVRGIVHVERRSACVSGSCATHWDAGA